MGARKFVNTTASKKSYFEQKGILVNESQYRDPWHIVDEFNSTYWSGLDANIFVNGIHLGEMVSIQYQIVEQVTPYYGYSYYTAQRMHRGQRIISGSFLINFQQPGYLFRLLQELPTSSVLQGSSAPSLAGELTINASNIADGYGAIDINDMPSVVSSNSQNENAPKVNESGRELAFSDLRKLTWNAPDTYTAKFDVDTYPALAASRKSLYGSKGGLVIKIAYGNPVDEGMVLTKNAFGDYEKNVLVDSNYTVGIVSAIELLSGVEITGLSKVIDDSGRSIMEQYSFLARDYMDLTPAAND